MKEINITYIDFKTDLLSKGFPFYYKKFYPDNNDSSVYNYEIYSGDSVMLWSSIISASADIDEFESVYKVKGNKNPYTEDGKQWVRSESRPSDCMSMFASAGDTPTLIGGGKSMFWDFSNDEDLIAAPSNYKRKRIEFSFIDPVYIKNGGIYFHNTLKGSYIGVSIVCPAGVYYLNNDGIPTLAQQDTVAVKYVDKMFIQGTCPMGDELNTDTLSPSIPVLYKFWVDVTVPSEDIVSNGYAVLTIYRKRTVIL